MQYFSNRRRSFIFETCDRVSPFSMHYEHVEIFLCNSYWIKYVQSAASNLQKHHRKSPTELNSISTAEPELIKFWPKEKRRSMNINHEPKRRRTLEAKTLIFSRAHICELEQFQDSFVAKYSLNRWCEAQMEQTSSLIAENDKDSHVVVIRMFERISRSCSRSGFAAFKKTRHGRASNESLFAYPWNLSRFLCSLTTRTRQPKL